VRQKIQLALSNSGYREALRSSLVGDRAFRDCEVEPVWTPEPSKADVLVVDSAAFDRLATPLLHPERIVLITQHNPKHLTRAWNAGIVSVIGDHEPVSTAMLAILAARYRACKCVA